GVLSVIVLQVVIMAVVMSSRQAFRGSDTAVTDDEMTTVKLAGSDWLLPSFYFVYGVELVIGKYVSSFAVDHWQYSATTATNVATLFWAGLMVGRFLTGVTTRWQSNRRLILTHIILTAIATGMMFLPVEALLPFAGFGLGLGLSAIYPLMMMVPYARYNDQKAKRVVSWNLAFCQAGMVVLPLVTGWTYQAVGAMSLPIIILILVGAMLGLGSVILRQN
ncbi:MAG: MFS transporter, partial [Weissella cibaria]